MFTYFAHRVLVMIPTLLVISVITFIIIRHPAGRPGLVF
jgi:ABC-type microcin C transport system permease subunit YejB